MKATYHNNEIKIAESFRAHDLEDLTKIASSAGRTLKDIKIAIDENCSISELSITALKSIIPSQNIQVPEDKTKILNQEFKNSKKPGLGLFARIGKEAIATSTEIKSIALFLSEVLKEVLYAILHPKKFRLKETISQIDQCGFFAIGIVSLVTFLIGIVIAYLMGNQLQYYGANIFVVDGVTVSMCRELSPILVAIVVAGRSGSAFAAELGSMKLNQETDALESLGLRNFQILVLPRIIGLMISLPFLVIIGDIFGIFGGMCISSIHLDVGFENFIDRMHVILKPKQVLVGLIKAPIFALFISAIGCKLGLEAERNSVSIGRNTTKTVVQSIVSVILLNAAAAIIFTNLGI